MKKEKRKLRRKTAPVEKGQRGKANPANHEHRAGFEQLLDDAIFGVKKKNRRG